MIKRLAFLFVSAGALMLSTACASVYKDDASRSAFRNIDALNTNRDNVSARFVWNVTENGQSGRTLTGIVKKDGRLRFDCVDNKTKKNVYSIIGDPGKSWNIRKDKAAEEISPDSLMLYHAIWFRPLSDGLEQVSLRETKDSRQVFDLTLKDCYGGGSMILETQELAQRNIISRLTIDRSTSFCKDSVILEDFTDRFGMRIPEKMTVEFGVRKTIFTLKSFETNVNVSDDLFRLDKM